MTVRLEPVTVDGRLVSRATAWWVGRMDPSRLFCAHSVRLDRRCADCLSIDEKESD